MQAPAELQSGYRAAFLQRLQEQVNSTPKISHDSNNIGEGGGGSQMHQNEAAASPQSSKINYPKPQKVVKKQGGKEAAGSDQGTMNPPQVAAPTEESQDQVA